MMVVLPNILLVIVLVKNVASQQNAEPAKVIQSCTIGSVSENDHVKCICTHLNKYRCVLKEKANVTNDHYQVNHTSDPENASCEPNRVYEQDTMTCICNQNGTWPHDHCFESLKSLPENAVVVQKCEPGTYVKVDCNVCLCDAKGQIDSQHCTNNECGKLDRRSSDEGNKMYGDCACGNWYSLAPCQFCYCFNKNKLVCNTGTSLMTNDKYLKLGTYNLHICGKKLSKEMRDLESGNQESLRQGREVDAVEPQDAEITSPRSSTSPKPSVQPQMSESKVGIEEEPKESRETKVQSNNENIVADVISSESDESKAEQEKGIEIKHNIMPMRQSTKLPYDDEDEYEVSQEQTVGGIREIYDDKVREKPIDHHGEREREKQFDYHGEQDQHNENDVKLKDTTDKREDNDYYHHPEPLRSQKSEVKRKPYREQKQESDYEEEMAQAPKGLQIPVPDTMQLVANEDFQPRQSVNANPFSNLAFNMKLDLPQMLGQVFKLALRKSMVTINSDQKCTPGAVDVKDCNTCFCMKNSKMLCTAKKCD